MNIKSIIEAFTYAVNSGKKYYFDNKMAKGRFTIVTSFNNGAPISVMVGDLENVDKEPVEPIVCVGFPEVMGVFPKPILDDMVSTTLNDSEMIAVSIHNLRAIIDIAKGYDDFDDRAFGALAAMNKNLEDWSHFNEELKAKRESHTHY